MMASWEHFNAFKSLQKRQRNPSSPINEARSTAQSENISPGENDQPEGSSDAPPAVPPDDEFDDESDDQSDDSSQYFAPDAPSPTGGRVIQIGSQGKIEILELETANLIRDLFSQADILSAEQPRENQRASPLEIDYPYSSLLLIRPKLVHFAEQESTAAQLKADIHSLLKILLPTIWETRESSIVGIDTIARQSTIIARGKVKFSELSTLFLPGELVYSETIDTNKDLAYEQCWVVASCTSVVFRGRRAVEIRAIQWAWSRSSLSICLDDSVMTTITEYLGDKDICVSKLGIVPLKIMPEGNELEIRNRLIIRGRKYVEAFRTEGSCWEYSGSAVRYRDTQWSLVDLISLQEAKRGAWSNGNRFNAMIQTRVVLAPVLLAQYYFDEAEAWEVLKSTNQLSDETYLICSGKVAVFNVPDGEQILIQVNNLQTIKWDTERLRGGLVEASQEALNVIQEAFLFKNDIPTRVINPCQGFIVTVRVSNSRDVTQQIDAMAERKERIHLHPDFLEYVNVPADNPDRGDMLQFFNMGIKAGVILSFHNIAPLLQKRTFEDRELSDRITNFIRRLKVYPGAIFIFLGLDDQIDPEFERLQSREIRIPQDQTH